MDHLSLTERLPQEQSGAWLGRALRETIRTGRLRAGTRLPSSRSLSQQHHLARGTVVEVFDQLITEGYLESRHGSGTYVSAALPDSFFRPALSLPVRPSAGKIRAPLSPRGQELARSPFYGILPSSRPRAFRPYQPEVEHFPIDVWAKLCARNFRRVTPEMLLSNDEFGWRPLQEAVVEHLAYTRGVLCMPEQVMVVSGTQHALDFISRLLLAPGDPVWMEDPGYPGATAIFRAAGAHVIPVPVDEEGMNVSKAIHKPARLAYVTPANQFPLGTMLSLRRRMQLLEWSERTGAWIFEDDYDSEFRFSGQPLPALQGLTEYSNVIFSCSLNKMLFPTLRMGFLILPKSLVEPARAARSLLDRYPPMLDQLVVADFITEGHFGKHLRKMRMIYAERHAFLHQEAADLSGLLTLGRCDTGLQTTAWLPEGTDALDHTKHLATHGLEVMPLSPYSLKWPLKHGVHLGFGAVNEKELKRGINVMRKVLTSKAIHS